MSDKTSPATHGRLTSNSLAGVTVHCLLREDSLCVYKLIVFVLTPFTPPRYRCMLYSDQLAIVDSIMEENTDCHVIIGGDFNVDLSRPRVHTAMLKSFCDNASLSPADLHPSAIIDYSYHFDLRKFSVLDHFLLSETMFNTSISSVYAMHDVDNTSDHEPLCCSCVCKLSLFSILTEYTCRRLHGVELVLRTVIVIETVYLRHCVVLLCQMKLLHAVQLTCLLYTSDAADE